MGEPVKPRCIEDLELFMKKLSGEAGGQRIVLRATITRAGAFHWELQYEQLEHLSEEGDPLPKDK